MLSSLQDKGLTDVVLHALLVKDVPATREVLGSLPNVFSALCLNTRGLDAFVACKPFDRLFKVLYCAAEAHLSCCPCFALAILAFLRKRDITPTGAAVS